MTAGMACCQRSVAARTCSRHLRCVLDGHRAWLQDLTTHPPRDLQLPAAVVHAELDEMLADVLSSPDKSTHMLVAEHRRKGMNPKNWYPGPTSQEVMNAGCGLNCQA